MHSKLGPTEPKTDNLHPVVARLQREIERDGLRTPRLDSEGRLQATISPGWSILPSLKLRFDRSFIDDGPY